MNKIKQHGTKDKKASKRKRPVLSNWFDLEYLYTELESKGTQEGFPDILHSKEWLQSFVDAVRSNPRLLYDEAYVINMKPHLVYKNESIIKVVISKLQLVFLEIIDNPKWSSLERAIEAKEWIEKFFDAAKEGLTQQLKLLKGRHPNLPLLEGTKTEIRRRWKIFRNQGIKALEKRYRNPYKESKRLIDLKQFVKSVQSKFPNQIDDELILDELNYHFTKREPLLKGVFAHLMGITKNSKRKKSPNSVVKAVDRILNTNPSKFKNHKPG